MLKRAYKTYQNRLLEIWKERGESNGNRRFINVNELKNWLGCCISGIKTQV